ncbi:VWA domain-containing protein [Paenibacillus qinlingensis]|uniref:Ca-activated chloride channel family protein n=1 Tax=Paenibacillus qinlingensis TaxID=1837343 RepID=A0ABU1P616_9BACL|nr:VWA domain-containing protein [Paenibacillus qinlingensis]MDR6555198.1 Ca-activated chloride channel family protein [Paenibacillus qinlingensis]
MKKSKFFLLSVFLIIIVFIAVYAGVSYTTHLGKTDLQITAEDAAKQLSKAYGKISVTNGTPVKGQIDINPADVASSLPDISKFPITVNNTTDNFVEIFSSTEKSGSGVDGWLTDVANAFNKAQIQVNGRPASVKIRNIASGTAADYIKSGAYLPDAYTPSNELWGEMVKAAGVKTQLVAKRLVGNVPGIVISKKKYDTLVEKYGPINVQTMTEAIANNDFAMGYTDPFASSTGLNFLVTALRTFDSANPISEKAVQGFEKFQTNVPFIASTTLQMRDAAKSGMLDGFVLEYQTFQNASELTSDYMFTPFGYRHDSPLYAIGDLPAAKLNVINQFAEFIAQAKYQQAAKEKGFNGLENYKNDLTIMDGNILTSAQKVWKEKKNGSKPLAAVFVTDVSGSMDGKPISRLKESLLKGQKYLGKENRIGLVSYSNGVTINLPIAKYDTNQQSLFVGTVNSLQAGGGTATFDAIVVAMKMLQDYMAADPNVKPLIFVLSDGETNAGHSLKDIQGMIESYHIPIYTIGYNADIEALQRISSINEAASINADTDDVVYKISNLLNVQM